MGVDAGLLLLRSPFPTMAFRVGEAACLSAHRYSRLQIAAGKSQRRLFDQTLMTMSEIDRLVEKMRGRQFVNLTASNTSMGHRVEILRGRLVASVMRGRDQTRDAFSFIIMVHRSARPRFAWPLAEKGIAWEGTTSIFWRVSNSAKNLSEDQPARDGPGHRA